MTAAERAAPLPLAPVSLDLELDIETPELVVITYSVAGIGSRIKAGAIDLAISLALWFAILITYFFLGLRTGDFWGAWAGAILVLLQFVILSGYYVLMEGLRDGQTIGKKAVGIRVVREGGYSVTFGASAARNILRVIDFQPVGVPAVGLIAMMFSKAGRRIGDMVAGTIVVRERTAPAQVAQSSGRPHDAEAATPAASVLTEEEFDVLDRYVQRRSNIPAEQRAKMTAALSARFRGRIGSELEGHPAFLLQLHDRESAARRSGRGARDSKGAARERHAIISEGKARWAAFSRRLKDIDVKGLDKLTDSELTSFASSYREIAGDLARLRTATRTKDAGDVFYLSRIVAAGHNLFYRAGRDEMSAIGKFLVRRVPVEVRRSWRVILLSAALFFGPMGATYVALRAHPERVRDVVGPGMISRAEEGVERARKGTGYIQDPKEFRPMMGSFIITNNIKVALLAFAAGITLLGTPMVLVFNAISIGGVLALYANKGIFPLLAAFVIPHTVLELSAITIASAGGLLLGAAILNPGRRTRRDAVIEAAQRSLRLVACASLFLVFAGILEGFVSPNPNIPIRLKLVVSAVSAAAMIAYLSLGREPRESRAP